MCDGFLLSGELEKPTSQIPAWRLVVKLVIRAHEPYCAVTEQLLGSKSADCAMADSPPRNNADSAVEGHYLRALGVTMSDLGADNYKSASDKDKKWEFREYKGNTVVFRKYLKAAADVDPLSAEISCIQAVVDDYDHVSITNACADSQEKK